MPQEQNRLSVEDNQGAPSRGKTYISDDVISIIARSVAVDVPGVHQIGESKFRNMLPRLGRGYGVDGESGLKEAAADIEVVVELGLPIRSVTEEIRKRVIETVEAMTGREMVEVNIYVVDVHVSSVQGQRKHRELR